MRDEVVDAGEVDRIGADGLRRVEEDRSPGGPQRVEVDDAALGRLDEADGDQGGALVDGLGEPLERREPQLDAARLEVAEGEHRRGEVALVEDDVRALIGRQARRDQAGRHGVVPTRATSSARAPMSPAKSSRQASPSSSQSRQRRPVRQPASASSIAARVERGGRP